MLDKVEITIRRKVGEQNALYGSVTNSDVADELEKKGFEIEKRKIHMDDHIKKIGEFSDPDSPLQRRHRARQVESRAGTRRVETNFEFGIRNSD